jgi:hypothetical protein
MRFTRSVLVLVICFILIAPESGKAAATIPSCPTGNIIGHPPIAQIPSYDYGSNGLLQFHFHLSLPQWNYNTLKVGLYNDNCILQSEPAFGQVGGAFLPPVKNLVVKVVDAEPGKYNFKVFDEDTGQFHGTGLGFVPNDFNSPNISITLSSVTGSFNAPIVDIITTPAAPLHGIAPLPRREPVLIIPGVLGTTLLHNEDLLWPDLSQMLLDMGDNFLDELAFNSDLTPASNSITVGDLVKAPFPGEHYYDSLLHSLQETGYTENQDLFVFPYDWRYGISEAIVADLASTIRALAGAGKINVIAHSTGGLLLKKAVQENGGAHIDKAIMIAVPNYGAAKAAKALLYGDDMGIPWLDSAEIKKIGQNMPVMYDLLPSPQYETIYGSYFQQVIPDLLNPRLNQFDFQATTDHLTNDYGLNWLAFRNATSLHSYAFDNLDLTAAGINVFTLAGCGAPTLSAVTEIKQPFSSQSFPFPIQPAIVSGDGTVALRSALGNNPGDQTFYLLFPNHGKLPGHNGATEAINGILDNDIPQNFSSHLVTRDETKCELKGKLISIFGDVAIKVISTAGSAIFPDTTLGNASDIQLVQQPNYSLLHLPDYALGYKVELTSQADNNLVNIRIDNANGLGGPTPQKVFTDLSLAKNSTLTLTSLDTPEPAIGPVIGLPSTSAGGHGASSGGSRAASSRPAAESLPLEPAAAPHPEHTLVKFGPTIYLLENGQRRGFRTYGEFLSYGYSPEQVLEGNSADWNLREGLIMLAKPDILVKDTANPNKLYFLNQNMEKQWIATKKLATEWLARFATIFDIDLAGYRTGLDILK